jgi:hypothetical protein
LANHIKHARSSSEHRRRRQSSSIALAAPKRDYKIFTVLKTTGEVTSMRMRELAVT